MADLRDVFGELIRYETELWNSVDAQLRGDFDLPLARFEVMRVIDDGHACRVFDIANALSITVGGTSKLVDRIEAAGHCRRHANPDDRRSSIIELTPAGRRLLAKATKAFERELQILADVVRQRDPATPWQRRFLGRSQAAGGNRSHDRSESRRASRPRGTRLPARADRRGSRPCRRRAAQWSDPDIHLERDFVEPAGGDVEDEAAQRFMLGHEWARLDAA